MRHRWITWGALAIGTSLGLAACSPSDEPPLSLPPGAAGPVDFGAAGAAASCDAFGPVPPGAGGPGAFPRSTHVFEIAVQTLEQAPPPISGGTLLATRDGKLLIAADPDRDAIYIIDVQSRSLVRQHALEPADEPGRLVEDAAGRVHVALRGGRSLASFAPISDAPLRRTQVCELPRGVAYDAARNRVYVACADGPLVAVDPEAGKPIEKLELGRDLRDVLVRDGKLLVTRFRSAELMEIDASGGRVMNVRRPPATVHEEEVFVQEAHGLDAQGNCFGGGRIETRMNQSTPNVAWRSIDVPGRGVAMIHQRSSEAEVRITPGGYGGSTTCAPGIVHGALSLGDDLGDSVDLAVPGLFVDLAVDPSGAMLAAANPAGWGSPSSVVVFTMVAPGAPRLGGDPIRGLECRGPSQSYTVEGQPTAVTFVNEWMLAVQEREPAGITLLDMRPTGLAQRIELQQPSRHDTGHALFHTTTSSGIACASCHAEAGDDAHVWTFEGIGPRRTQTLRGGILGSEPFHWNGDMHDFSMLVEEVFVGRMLAQSPTPGQADALATWIDRQPLLRAPVKDAAKVARGEALFHSETVGCGSCHGGARLSNNESADVGTGALLQVPSLRAVSFRQPVMHDGCAATLVDRFAADCGGGDKHGRTSHLNADEIGDLVAYLESL